MNDQQLQPGELVVAPPHVTDAVTIITLAGDLDMATTPSLIRALAEVEERPQPIVLDLDGLTFIDSHGIHALLRHARSHRLVLARPGPNVARVFELTNAHSTIRITDTLEAAMAASQNGGVRSDT